MKTKIFIYGAGKIAESVSYYFNRDSDFEIAAYVIDDEFYKEDSFLNKPLLKLSDINSKFNPKDYKVFVAVGYQSMNAFRADKYLYFKKLGYNFVSYVSPFVKGNFAYGENTIIMDNAIIQPCANFGNNVFVWGGALVGHHTNVEDNVWLTGGCLIGGASNIGANSFIGLGAIISNEMIVGAKSLIGANSLVSKNLTEKSVVLVGNTEPHRLNSEQFVRFSKSF